jgi:hypothetical protein
MPKPSKRDQLVEATKELLWEVGYEAMSLATFKPEAPPSPAALLEPVLGGPLLGTFCRADRASQCLFMNENRKTFSRFEVSHFDPKGSSARNLEPWYAPHLWARVERRAHRQSRVLMGQDLDAKPSQ